MLMNINSDIRVFVFTWFCWWCSLETTRHVSMITIILSKKELDTSSIGWVSIFGCMPLFTLMDLIKWIICWWPSDALGTKLHLDSLSSCYRENWIDMCSLDTESCYLLKGLSSSLYCYYDRVCCCKKLPSHSSSLWKFSITLPFSCD